MPEDSKPAEPKTPGSPGAPALLPDDGGRPDQDRKRQATIFDVAAEAGVAVGTVSRYLNGLPMRAENRARVEAAIQLLRYHRNAVAQAMRTDRTNMVALLVPGYDEFFSSMLASLSNRLNEAGKVLLTHQHEGDARALGLALEFFRHHRVNAIVAPGIEEVRPELEALMNLGIPIILFNNDVAGLGVDRVFSRNRDAARRAVAHLLALGHRNIGIIRGSLTETSGQLRYEGYLDALKDAGIAVNPDYVVGDSWSRREAEAAVLRLMEAKPRPTAVFASNYVLAFALMDWMQGEGLAIGRDISLVSFDDIELFRQIRPAVTAVAQPSREIGERIADLVLDHMAGRRLKAPRTIMLDCNIILRDSAAPPDELYVSGRLSGTSVA